jgi:hypothetical protein
MSPKHLWHDLLLKQKVTNDDGPTCDDMHILFNKQVDSRIILNLLKYIATILFDILYA